MSVDGPGDIGPDRAEIARFVKALFRYAEGGGSASLRAFYDDKRGSPPYEIVTVRLNGAGLEPLIAAAYKLATKAARAERPVVVAPPIATFAGGKADEASLREGLVLSVELDGRAAAAVDVLRAVLGPPTLVVASGGEWTNPETGEIEPKLHAHWRLKEPTRTPGEHARLKRARTLACELVGADGTAKTAVHAMRWAGTVHRKDPTNPRRCRIVEENAEAEIALEDALAELDGLAILRGQAEVDSPKRPAGDRSADDELLRACAELLTNPLPPKEPGGRRRGDWDDWNRIGLAFWGASDGSEAGLAAFDTFSAKNKAKYDLATTRARWEHYRTSPPTSIGAGTLVHEARRIDPTFRASKPGLRPEAGSTSDTRVEIEVAPGRRARIVGRCVELLNGMEGEGAIFRRGGVPVVLRFVKKDEPQRFGASKGKLPAGNAVLCRAGPPEHVMLALDRIARFRSPGSKGEKDASKQLAALVLASGGLRPIAGIIRSPTLRPDGTVLDRPGYDGATGLYYAPAEHFPPVPPNPTREDAKAALETLKSPFREFPFVGEVDLAVGLAEQLTVQLRHLVPRAPGFIHDATEGGSGKTLLAEVIGETVLGVLPPNYPAVALRSEEETKKLLTTLTLAATPYALLDNAERGSEIDNAALNQFQTSVVYGDRLLGGNEELAALTTTVVVVTGNRVSAKGDASRRYLPVTLDPKVERPELVEHTFDVHAEVQADRPKLVVAALTLMRAFILAGGPKVPGRALLGSFEEWDGLVCGALVWAGAPDPASALEKTRGHDPERERLAAVLHHLRRAFGPRWFKCKQATDVAHGDEDLRDALFDVAWSPSGKLEPRLLGEYLKKNAGRTVEVSWVEAKHDTDTKTYRYRVVERGDDPRVSRGSDGGRDGRTPVKESDVSQGLGADYGGLRGSFHASKEHSLGEATQGREINRKEGAHRNSDGRERPPLTPGTPVNRPSPSRPAWTDIDGYRARVQAAGGDSEVLRKVATTWVAAAGGVVSGNTVLLPELPDCMALAELRALAREVGLDVQVRTTDDRSRGQRDYLARLGRDTFGTERQRV